MPTPTSKYANVLDRATLVPLGAVVAALVLLFGGGFTAWRAWDIRLATIESLQRGQNRDIQQLRLEVTTDQWTRTDQRLWVAELRRQNPNLPIPSAEDKQ